MSEEDMSLGVKVPDWAKFKTGDEKVQLLTKFAREVTKVVLPDQLEQVSLESRLTTAELHNTLDSVLLRIQTEKTVLAKCKAAAAADLAKCKMECESKILQLEDYFVEQAKKGFEFDPDLTPEDINRKRILHHALESANPYRV